MNEKEAYLLEENVKRREEREKTRQEIVHLLIRRDEIEQTLERLKAKHRELSELSPSETKALMDAGMLKVFVKKEEGVKHG